jgi:hypothetical protein
MPFRWNGHVVVLMVFKNPAHTGWQIDNLSGQGVHVVLQVNVKVAMHFGQHLAGWQGMPGVLLVPDPVTLNWSGASQVRAILTGVNLALEKLPAFTHLHLMSGQCLPFRNFDEIERR